MRRRTTPMLGESVTPAWIQKLTHSSIIKDFYLSSKEGKHRPRVFGMTASPVDAKMDVTQVAEQLEALLHSRIATTNDMSLTAAVKKPDEKILSYDALPLPYDTELLQACKSRFGHVAAFRPAMDKCPSIARELGTWCSDQYLVDALGEKRLKRFEDRTEQKFHAQFSELNVKDLDDRQSELRAAVEFIEAERSKTSGTGIEETKLSHKVLQLQKYLAAQYERPTSQRCIVFVEQRYTARLLDTLFQRIGTQYLKTAFLVGSNDKDGDGLTFRQQVMTLIKFRQGEVNCLFATSVAEEGLDIPDCNLVIRFNMFKTMIQYVQSRGRARQQNSKFIHMAEKGDFNQLELISEVRFQEKVMRRFCQSLPEDRRLIGQEDNLEVILEKEKNLRVYEDPTSGAKLTYGNALAVLANYVSVLPTNTDEPMHPVYVVSSKGNAKFISEVLLPQGAAMRSIIGRPHTKKTLAKRAAAFDACIELRKKGHLDENLLSTHRRKVNAMRNAMLAKGMDKTNQYVMQVKPSIWEKGRDTLPSELWLTVLDFPDGLERPHRPLGLLTRTKLPEMPAFPLFLNDSRQSMAYSRPLDAPLKITQQTGLFEKLTRFTFRVLLDVFSKKFEPEGMKLSYWLAPLASTAKDGGTTLDFDLLELVFAREEVPWTTTMSAKDLVGRFFVDKWDGGRKFVSTGISAHLAPDDLVPEGAPKSRHGNTIMDYTVSLWKKAKERAVWNAHQPVLQAEKILLRLNNLATPSPKEKSRSANLVYLCPEPLKISTLPPDVVTSCFMFPAMIHRIESYLIALEACDKVGVVCNPDVALEAVTKDSDNSGEHESEERINFQRGMGPNYERLEFIGDTFLKTATTISTFIGKPEDLEADLHVTRMLMLCNKNLFDGAKKFELSRYVRSIAFSRRLWYPEGLKLLEGKGVKKNEETQVIKHGLGNKSIADVCEAMIGAAFVTHDRPGEIWKEPNFDPAVKAVTTFVDSPDHAMNCWDDYRRAYVLPSYQTGQATASQKDLAEKVELEHPYHFRYPRLVRSAFVHPSQPHMYELVPNYERLEFLGDALLDMASITHLFYRFPDKDPQWLTEHKMAMVSNKFLSAVCVNMGFYKHLRYGSSILEHQIRAYITELLEAKATAGSSRDYWTSVSDPPKCLPDIVESFVGAMFIDSDFDYNVVQDFFDRNIKWYFEDMSIYDGFANNHPCTHLHNLLQTNYGCSDYRLMAAEMPAPDGVELEKKDVVAVVMIHDRIVNHSKGKSGRYARLRVAKDALALLDGLAPYEFRAQFGCDCPSTSRQSEDEKVAADCGA